MMMMQNCFNFLTAAVFATLTVFAMPVQAQHETEELTPQSAPPTATEDELAKQLANPVAALISVPFQFNYDTNIGPSDDGERFQLNLQPVVPFELDNGWTLISRTIVPVIDQRDILPGSGHQTGLGDTVQSLFFCPRPGSNGVIWGFGPVFLFPTATDDLLGAEKWGAGPTVVALKQSNSWTYGFLANHIESFAGTGSRADISSTLFNPFLSKQFEGGWSLGTQVEHTFDHKNSLDTGSASVFLSKVTKIGDQMVSFSVTPKYWYEDTDYSPEGFGLRLAITFLFPK